MRAAASNTAARRPLSAQLVTVATLAAASSRSASGSTAANFDAMALMRDGVHGAAAGDGAILAPMPGKVIAVAVSEGEAVTRGQKLLTLEAMKMEHTLTAPFDGIVTELKVSAGAQVQVEALLARIEAEEGAA